jgi:phosphinothricin acetyltransferase
VRIRDARLDDAGAICAIYNSTIPTTTVAWTEQLESVDHRLCWIRDQASAGNPVLVATDGDGDESVIGFASYDDFRDAQKWEGYRFTVEHSVHVDGAHHGSGVGQALMIELLARAAAAGKRVMVAAVDGDNEGSIRFHERLGFVEVARLPGVGFKFGRWLDLVLLQRHLGDAG